MTNLHHTSSPKNGESKKPCIAFSGDGDAVVCRFGGKWSLNDDFRDELQQDWKSYLKRNSSFNEMSFELEESVQWDSTLVVFLSKMIGTLDASGKKIVLNDLPEGLSSLLNMSGLSPTISKNQYANRKLYFPDLKFLFFASRFVSFWGEWVLAFSRLVCGKSKMRWYDFTEAARSSGASALPIVTLISFLTGLTMAFVGSVQLEKFNAKIYVADLVSLAMVREMGALMVAIIMAGRTGAAFAAEIGNMKLNEEIDSLRTFGISPIDFLVLPRTLALFLMTPLLTLYADVVGMLGGLAVGTQVMDFSVLHYFEQTQSALSSMWEIFSGLLKSLLFGLIIGLVGCYKGLNAGSNSASLGKAVTSAVVLSITLIVVCDAMFEIIFSYLDLR